ncbi:hypothetical protein BpHYR1_027208 [Brachionus plicatilis]|uniref:Uncharacterized protein n=1 Tax=Brachionus plicatilis TaxID=10195 RepID=A0A3M7PKQ0_BRAPC|nr:hypothetical protein BpHYR1_027208 [Brachionus plicatilis]
MLIYYIFTSTIFVLFLINLANPKLKNEIEFKNYNLMNTTLNIVYIKSNKTLSEREQAFVGDYYLSGINYY